jgi:hypothetical protein
MPILLIFLMLPWAIAQHSSQPQKESSSDLRSGLVVFSIEDVKDKDILWLERTNNLDYFLRMKFKSGKEKIQKVTTKDAHKLDRDFASRFLKIQYEFPESESDCKVGYHLTLKSEKQIVCLKDEQKAQEVKPFRDDLLKRF